MNKPVPVPPRQTLARASAAAYHALANMDYRRRGSVAEACLINSVRVLTRCHIAICLGGQVLADFRLDMGDEREI